MILGEIGNSAEISAEQLDYFYCCFLGFNIYVRQVHTWNTVYLTIKIQQLFILTSYLRQWLSFDMFTPHNHNSRPIYRQTPLRLQPNLRSKIKIISSSLRIEIDIANSSNRIDLIQTSHKSNRWILTRLQCTIIHNIIMCNSHRFYRFAASLWPIMIGNAH